MGAVSLLVAMGTLVCGFGWWAGLSLIGGSGWYIWGRWQVFDCGSFLFGSGFGSWHVGVCHGSIRDASPQGRPGVARPSKVRTKDIGRKECQESQRKHVDRSDGSGRESWRNENADQIT